MSDVAPTVSEEDLVAFADDRIAPERRPTVETWLAEHPEDRTKVKTWQAQTALLRAALDPVLDEPVPPVLARTLKRRRFRPRWSSLAAASITLVVGLGAGWLAGINGVPAFGSGALRNAARIGDEGIAAHRVYVSEVRHPVEVGANEETHLVNWLSKRLDFRISAPDLSGDGLKLLGGRLVPVNGQPGAMLMYEGRSGERYTLFVARSDTSQATAFRYEESGGYGTFYWIDGPGGYALTGPADRVKLLKIAEAVYDQLPLAGAAH